ncbi:MAG: NAD-dependent deacylase [Deltaproteobacteria bacterium]|nr:MAG: NAD-dependent deacylase [Deltaproteobacteria bacterium]
MSFSSALASAKQILDEADAITVMTGAGISAESGVPTFRGTGGLWKGKDPMTLATPEAFFADPDFVWEWYDHRRAELSRCAPNAAHHALVQLEEQTADFTLATQNVDGLHRAAGSRRIVHLHGDIFTVRCTDCGNERVDRTHGWSGPPHCARCGGLERPGVVWFGEALPEGSLEAVGEAVGRCDAFLIIGTSGLVWPAAGFAGLARRLGRPVILVNLEPTEQSSLATVELYGRAGEILPRLISG